MASEADLTADFFRYLRDRGFICLKFNDRIATGFPDGAIVGRGRTWWVEFKRWPIDITDVQLDMMEKLEMKNADRSAIIVVWPKKQLSLIYPSMYYPELGESQVPKMTYDDLTWRLR